MLHVTITIDECRLLRHTEHLLRESVRDCEGHPSNIIAVGIQLALCTVV